MEVSGLYIYPVKSLGGISLESSEVGLKGLKYDRRYVLVNDNGVFVSQRTIAKMCLLKVSKEEGGFEVEHVESGDKLIIPLALENGKKVKVKIWDDEVNCILADNRMNEWFTEKLGINLRLCFQPDDEIRKTDPKYSITNEDQTSLSDGYPILIVSEESIAEINERCPEQIDILRFRPNIVIRGGGAFEEDDLGEFKLGSTKLVGVKKCARCQVVNIDYKTSLSGAEPLKSLSGFRKLGNKVLVGMNIIVQGSGKIVLNDIIEI